MFSVCTFRNILVLGCLATAAALFTPSRCQAAPDNQTIVFKILDPSLAQRALSSGEIELADMGKIRIDAALPPLKNDPTGLNRIFKTPATTHPKLLQALQQDARLQWAEIPPPRHTDLVPNDPDYDQLWALPQVEAPAAWDSHRCFGDALIAIVDTGTDQTHPDLAANVYTNQLEADGLSGVDDDGNGYVDDIHGWDVLDSDNDANPGVGDHGTHVSGTAACVTDNSTGVACIGWNPQLLPVRAGSGTTIGAGIEGIYYAFVSGADVINCSWGGDSYSYYEQNVIEAARLAGSLVVAAAGNGGSSQPHYPAAYDGVLSVVNFMSNDVKSSSSQYGCWVDLGAPGTSIISTTFNGNYTTKSGTSMATPQVSSLCALVKSQHPAYGPDAVREHVIFTCDNVDALNPDYAGLLGRGRINARRAMEENPPTLHLAGEELSETSGNGIIDPGEEFSIVLQLRQELGSLQNIQVSVSSTDARVTVIDGSASFGNGSPGSTLSNAGEPFVFLAGNDLPNGTRVDLIYAISADGGFSHHQCSAVVIAPIYATHNNSNLRLTVSSHGAIGYFDFESNQSRGEGFRWPADGPDHLYVGSLLLGQTGTQRVADVTSYLAGNPADFAPLPGSSINISTNGAEQLISASFDDSNMSTRIGLEVDLLSRTYDLPELQDGVILEYDFRNVTDHVLEGIVPGLWLDFDVGGTWADDTGGWDAERSLCWMSDGDGRYLGAMVISEEAQSFRLCEFGEWSPGGLSDSELIGYMTSGFTQVESDAADDWQCCLAGGVQNLEAGASRHIVFGLLGAESLNALQLLADNMDEWFLTDLPENPAGLVPADFRLLGVHPNPFNPRTEFQVQLATTGMFAWQVFDLQGRRIMASVPQQLTAGMHRFPLDFSAQASGNYILSLQSNGQRLSRPITLLK